MRFGLITPLYADFADMRAVAWLAHEAEGAGWDGFFVWNHIATATSPGGASTQPELLADP